jgi:hypothetical protein
MRIPLKAASLGALVAATAIGMGAVAAIGAGRSAPESKAAAATITRVLSPSSDQLAACMPGARLTVSVALTTDQIGYDSFTITASHLPPRRAYTVFLLQTAVTPFGAAEYIGDFFTDEDGNARNTFRLIVAEAFSSTLVGTTRVRRDLNRIGAWFADPAGDNFCLGASSPVTPFDGDNAAGVQVFNSRNAAPLPPP